MGINFTVSFVNLWVLLIFIFTHTPLDHKFNHLFSCHWTGKVKISTN